MRLAVIGASGRTGQQVMEQALSRGHQVTAFVRKPSLAEQPNLRVAVADPCKAEELLPALREQDAVISCLGQRSGGNPWLVRDAAVAALHAMEQVGVGRLVIVSGALLYPSLNPIVLLMKRIMAVKLRDGRATEAALAASSTRWTVVRPPRLLEKGGGKGYRIEAGPRPKLTTDLSFQDLAACLLDLAEGDAYAGQVVGVASL